MRMRILWLMVPFLLAAGLPAGAAQYYVTAAANYGGTVTPNKGKIPVAEGGSLDVTFKAYTSYYLAEVKVNNATVPLTGRKTFTKQFTDVRKNQVIAARFARDPFIVAGTNAGGTIEPKGKVFVPYSTSQTFSFTPNDGFHIKDVVVDGKGLVTPAVVGWEYPTSWTFDNIKAKHSLRVLFAINTYTVTLEPSLGGKIAPAMTTAKHGQTKIFTVAPNAGMKIKGVTVNGEPRTDFPTDGRPYQFSLMITGDVTIAAEFAELLPVGSQRLKGTYHVVSRESSFWKSTWGGSSSVSENLYANNITAKFDGQGGCSVSATGTDYSKQTDGSGNETVNAKTEPESFNCTYTVNDTNGTFTINIGTTETVTGWVSTDGNSVVVGGPMQKNEEGGTGYSVEETVGVRVGTTMTKGSLKGRYHLVSQEESFNTSSTGGTYVSNNLGVGNIIADFHGDGTCSVTYDGKNYNINTDGSGNQTVDPRTESNSFSNCTYTVTSTGFFTITLGTDKHSGWVSADGNSVVMGGATQESGNNNIDYRTELITGVRAGADMDLSSLAGSYNLVNSRLSFWQSTWYDGNNNKTTVSDSIGGGNITATFDGTGGCSVTVTDKEYSKGYDGNGNETVNIYPDPVQTPDPTQTFSDCTYIVDPDGKFTVTLVTPDGTESHSGRVGADGNSVIMGGPDQQSSDGGTGYSVELLFGVKAQVPQ